MISNDYKTFGNWFVKYDISSFLRNHSTTEITTTDDESLVSIAKDVFKNDFEQIESVKLYKAIKMYSNVLFGQYGNNTAVKKAVTTVEFLHGVCKVYNLLVSLKKRNSFRHYKSVVDAINSIDILLRSVPNNIHYTKLATTIYELYHNTIIEVGCERMVAALAQSSEEETEKTEAN